MTDLAKAAVHFMSAHDVAPDMRGAYAVAILFWRCLRTISIAISSDCS
ncbi:hypothetical protein SAMN05428989_0503 [Pseudoxanthomonas sp. GM95]|nr:hypothetical protein SAMN05428989_0503 [Pseudoxanthomonas sp. GM95]